MNEAPKYSPEMREEITQKVAALKPWYHKIDLGDGIVTPGYNFDHVWEATRKVMNTQDYRDKRVLDIASWDGMWAFEAEHRGAKLVVSSDARIDGYRNLLFVRGILGSEVIPLCNVPVQELETRLNIIGLEPEFDIVQHYGLLYHLRDPMLSLAQTRKILSSDGVLILETAFIDDEESSYMAFSGLPGQHHFYGISDTWAPTKLCLKEMLIRSFLEPAPMSEWESIHQGTVKIHGNDVPIGRVNLIAKPMPVESGHMLDARKVFGSQ